MKGRSGEEDRSDNDLQWVKVGGHTCRRETDGLKNPPRLVFLRLGNVSPTKPTDQRDTKTRTESRAGADRAPDGRGKEGTQLNVFHLRLQQAARAKVPLGWIVRAALFVGMEAEAELCAVEGRNTFLHPSTRDRKALCWLKGASRLSASPGALPNAIELCMAARIRSTASGASSRDLKIARRIWAIPAMCASLR